MATAAPRAKRIPMKDKTIISVFGHRPVAEHMLTDHYYKTDDTVPVVAPDLIIGLELEIEDWNGDDGLMPQFKYDTDGSLRNNGKECISWPVKTKYLPHLLTTFFRKHDITARNYSDRCSTHVHMNVQEMTFDQLKSLTLLYQTTERLLFNFVGNERDENIYCVPWYSSGLTANFVNRLMKDTNHAIKSWVKYSACNLLPVATQGTVEFRHLHGTCDVDTIMNWVNLIACLQVFAERNSFDSVANLIKEMNTVSNYDAFVTDVFREWSPLVMTGDYRSYLTTGVVDSKLMLMEMANKKQQSRFNLDTDALMRDLIQSRRRVEPRVDPPIAWTTEYESLGQTFIFNRETGQVETGLAPATVIPANMTIEPDLVARNITRISRNLDDMVGIAYRSEETMTAEEALGEYRTRDMNVLGVGINHDTGLYVPLRRQ